MGGTMGSTIRDTTVFSRVLYRLSYLAERRQVWPGSAPRPGTGPARAVSV